LTRIDGGHDQDWFVVSADSGAGHTNRNQELDLTA
jgi:hypothetical protein